MSSSLLSQTFARTVKRSWSCIHPFMSYLLQCWLKFLIELGPLKGNYVEKAFSQFEKENALPIVYDVGRGQQRVEMDVQDALAKKSQWISSVMPKMA